MNTAPDTQTVRPTRPAYRYGLVLLGIVALFAGVAARNRMAAAESLEKGDAARAVGEEDAAILQYRHAVELYTPLSQANASALDRLVALGDEALTRGDRTRALFAYRSARFAVLSTRHLFIPFEARLPALHRRIDAATLGDGSAAALGDYDQRLPSSWRGLLGAGAFLAWLVTLPLIAIKGFGKDGGTTRGLPYLALLAILLFIAWCGLLAGA